MKKVAILILALILTSLVGIEAIILKNRIRLSGCKDAMYIATIQRYGPVPDQFKEKVASDIDNACKQLLGVK